MIAFFAGLGYVFTNKKEVPPPLNEWWLGALLGSAGACGILMLWRLDMLLCQRLANAIFKDAMALESKHPWIPPIRASMNYAVKETRGAAAKAAWFYGPQIFLCSVTSVFCLSQSIMSPGFWRLAFVPTFSAVAASLLFWMYRRTRLQRG
jgi:hypothetical protein